MYTINDEILTLKELNVLMDVLKYSRLKNTKVISYQEFLNLTKTTIEQIMKKSLKQITDSNILYSCQIKDTNNLIKGEFIWKDNQIIINENVIKELYSNNILELVVILHELNHLLIKYEILTGKISYDLVRIIKELFIRTLNTNETYYQDNYKLVSEERIVSIHAIYDFIVLLEHFDIELSKYEDEQLKKELFQNKTKYQNYIRDVRTNSTFNLDFIDFEEAFEIMLKHHPEWLKKCPQINIEYYKDKKGNIKKRNKEQLLQLLELDLNKEKKEFIDILIKGNYKKILDKTFFTENEQNILTKSYSLKKKVKQKKYLQKNKTFFLINKEEAIL